MFWAWKPTAFDVSDVVPKSAHALFLDGLFHFKEVPILSGMAWVGRSVVAQNVFRKHELNVTATPCANGRCY